MGVKFDWDDEKTYEAPFLNSTISAVFLIAPGVLNALTPVKKFVEGALKNGVKRFVLLSASILEVGDGPAMGQVSLYLKGLGVEWAVLRPSWFMGMFLVLFTYSSTITIRGIGSPSLFLASTNQSETKL